MKTLVGLGAACALASLGGCIIIDDDGDVMDRGTSYAPFRASGYGSVFGATVETDAVVFRVTSNGCSDESYFDIDVRRRGDERYAVGLDRIREDDCRGFMPDGVDVVYTFDRIGIPEGADVAILNPVRRR